MEKKYQVFVSSTYIDLLNERQEVMQALLELDCIPVGMELFPAADDDQWTLIKRLIKDCDYYILIVGGRYGSIGDDGKSYTQMEYEFALKNNVPVISFLPKYPKKIEIGKSENSPELIKKLEQFKDLVQNKMCRFWENSSDLGSQVSRSLIKLIKSHPRPGWIKSPEGMTPDVIYEISRLSKENADLRKTIKSLDDKIIYDKKEVFAKTINTLKLNKRNISFRYEGVNPKWENVTEFSLYEIFNIIAPELLIENSINHFVYYLGFKLNPDKKRNVALKYATPINIIREIFADLSVLDITTPSKKRRSLKDEKEFWTLTEDGKKLFKEVRREILEKNISLNDDNNSRTED